MKKLALWVLTGTLCFLFSSHINDVLAATGYSFPKQMGLQQPATPVMERIYDFHNMLLYLISAITIFVFVLLIIIVLRFNAKANPKPAQFTHNTLLEVVWTVIPIIILVIVAVPSLKLVYYEDRTDQPEMTLKVTGYQWYWGYEYPDHDGINFFSYMIPDEEIDTSKGQLRLLSTDNPVVLPVETNIEILVTAGDVLHAFAIPSFGIKKDAVPGRINSTWIRINKPGTYYGQCSELCGKDHAFMPIEIKAVSKQDFNKWVQTARQEFSSNYKEEPVNYAKLEDKE
jgi:cytochrome c oxidase subunit 2